MTAENTDIWIMMEDIVEGAGDIAQDDQPVTMDDIAEKIRRATEELGISLHSASGVYRHYWDAQHFNADCWGSYPQTTAAPSDLTWEVFREAIRRGNVYYSSSPYTTASNYWRT